MSGRRGRAAAGRLAVKAAAGRRGGDCEAGRIGMLLVACVGIVAVFVLMSAAITSVAIQDRRLIACADRVAVAAAGAIDEGTYYTSNDARIVLSKGGAVFAAASALEGMSDTSCSVGTGVVLVDAHEDGAEVSVTVSAQATMPVLPMVFSSVVAPVLTRESSALIR